MKNRNKIIGVLMGATLAFAVFTGTISNVLAADTTQEIGSNCRGMGMHMKQGNGNMREAIAAFLGMDNSQIIASRQAGKSMVQIANEQGKSEEELYNFMFSQHKTKIDQMLASGQFSAEVAAAHETIMKERIKKNINRTDVGPACDRKNWGMGKGKHKGDGQGYCVNNH